MTSFRKELFNYREELELYFDTLSSIGIVFVDSALKIQDCNQGFKRIFQLQQKPLGSPLDDFLVLRKDDLKHNEELKLLCKYKKYRSGVNGILYCRAVETKNGHLLFCERLIMTESRTIEQIGSLNNELINLQRESVKKNLLLEKLRVELNDRIEELEATLSRVKQLEGIIPICSYCKKIRDDHDDWQGLERYISEHSEAQFSHGICPSCFEREIKELETEADNG